MSQTASSVSELDRVRAVVYQLLSSLFGREIDQARLEQLTQPQATAFWLQLGQDSRISDDVQVIMTQLKQIGNERQLLELAADYCGLFLIGSKHAPTPYASHFLVKGQEPLAFGEQHHLMSDFLKQSHLTVQSDFKEPADHLAVMLAYMGHLCTHASPEAQSAYLNDCLLSWLPAFCQQVERQDSGQFYQALARITLHWVDSDKQSLV
ncbi:molecular chaperone TorD [Shewanella sp. NIFS-20-20]|uniref:molecular chaperone TorD n=1 Tax=Shewanella sp. NIFS-20-20 TaxID=2853806 RepID=UPI001C492248|nr:molecular chaperone TorD [Shewanella sp. NIFS-20-20]MBV7314941.1 molecular chaperone TorD [Shewanella sp. NIFS-20-20]